MKLKNLRVGRPIASYTAVQKWIGTIRRNSKGQLRTERIRDIRYLDLGCGPNTHENFINLDYLWHPMVDVCWDITKGIPFPKASMLGIFSEHCLEHFPLPVGEVILRETQRVLMPGGRIRVIVPDAELYLTRYADRIRGLTEEPLPFEAAYNGITEPVLAVNRIFYQDREQMSGHWLIYDFNLLRGLLERCGFTQVARVAFMQGADDNLLIDTPSREIESLYVEAIKP